MKLVYIAGLLSCFFSTIYAFPRINAADEMYRVQEYARKCVEQTGVTQDDMAKMTENKLPKTRTGKCFMACMKKKLGFLNADNSVNVVDIVEKMKTHVLNPVVREKAIKVITICSKEVELLEDECEMATKLAECSMKYTKKFGLDDIKYNQS